MIRWSHVAAIVVVVALMVVLVPNWSLDATTSAAPPVVPGHTPTAVGRPAWTANVTPNGVGVRGSDGYLVLPERTGLRVYEAATGRERWHRLDTGEEVSFVEAGHGTVATVTTEPGHDPRVRAFDLDTGDELLAMPVAESIARLTVLAGGLLVSSSERLRMYSVADGEPRWERPLTGCPGSLGTTVRATADGTMVVLADTCHFGSHLVGLRAPDGAVRWRRGMPDMNPLSGGGLLADGAPLLLTGAGVVVAVDPRTGDVLGRGTVTEDFSDLTAVRGGWCTRSNPYEELVVDCHDARTSALTGRYRIPDIWGAPVNVRVLPVATGVVVAAALDERMSVGYLDLTAGQIRHSEFTVGSPASDLAYLGPGALVVAAAEGFGGTIFVHTGR